ncbi:MAG TPA: MdtA/MuxA family multidrug efflux RND transporter periplasmic adaptor subunit [Bryobacteraceae bacterium]|nr:MdtA/MuxA family multidrug efflux RND transporter periplasmic adaptor subunit [Bryobacteraceae bacterium]
MTTNTPSTDLHTSAPQHGHPAPAGLTPTGKPRKRGLIWGLSFAVILAVGAYAVWRAGQPGFMAQSNQGGRGGPGGGGGRGRGGLGPTPVQVAPAVRKAVPVYLNGLGNVAAYYTVTVKSRVDGELMSVNFKEGDMVQKGDVLAQIDPRPYQAQLDLYEGNLARDTALLQNARVDLDRYTTLLKQDAVPRQQLDTQVALVAQYEGTIKTDRANIDSARLNLTYSKIVAPISGRLGLRLVDPGNIVHAADTGGMLVITQLQPIAVLFTIPEDTLPQVLQKLREGAKLQAEAFSRDNSKKLATGILETVDNQIDPTTGTSKLKAIFQNGDNTLFPNQFVNIRLLVETLSNQVVIPTVAVQNGQQGTFVYVIDPSQDGGQTAQVHLRPVQVLQSDQSGAVIRAGVEEGEQVAVDGADRLQDGVVARIRTQEEMAREAAADAAAMARGRGRGRGGKKGGEGGDFKKGDFKKGGGGQ